MTHSTKRSIRDLATDPAQYDCGEVDWLMAGDQATHIRRLFLENLKPFITDIKGLHVLDVGCGTGWLCNAMASSGGKALGIDPSEKNIKKSKTNYPDLSFQRSTLQKFSTSQKFDLITIVMAFEHLADIDKSLIKIKNLLKS